MKTIIVAIESDQEYELVRGQIAAIPGVRLLEVEDQPVSKIRALAGKCRGKLSSSDEFSFQKEAVISVDPVV